MTARSSLLLALVLAGCERALAPAPPPPPPPPEPAAAEIERPAPRPARGESEEDPAECETAQAKIRFESPEIARAAGIETATVTARPIAAKVEASAVTAIDERSVARLSARAPGIVREARPLSGQDVAEGDVLAVLESSALGEAKAALRQAAAVFALREKTWAIERELQAGKVTSRREALAAEAAFDEARIELERARQRVRLLGVPEAALPAIECGADASPLAEIRAPLAGTVVERGATAGEAVEAGRLLYVLADLSQLMLRIDIPERAWLELAGAEEARLTFRLDGRPGAVFRGRLLSAGALVDPETRMVRATGEVRNASPSVGRRPLIPGMFGHVEIAAGDAEERLLVPRDAVQWEGCHFVVFLEVRPGFYQTRAVELGAELGALRQVRAGLAPGDRVVTTGSYLLKTEILKGSIGAGCCE